MMMGDLMPKFAKFYCKTTAVIDGSAVYKGKIYPAELICDLLHPETAQQIDESGYQEDFYQGFPVLTKNELGEGSAYYVATASDEAFYKQFLKDICEENGVLPVMELPEGVEAASRENDDERIIFLLNHNDTETEIDLPYPCQNLLSGAKMPAGRIVLPAKDVRLLRQV